MSASLRAILEEIAPDSPNTFPGVVIADHSPASFDNAFYHSRFDSADNINVASVIDVNSPLVVCPLS